MKFNVISFLLISFILFSCGNDVKNDNSNGTNNAFKTKIFNPKKDLIGEFSMEQNGDPQFKITKNKNSFFVQVMEDSKWSKPEKLKDVQNSDFEEFFGENWKDYVEAGMYKDAFGIFKVKKGSKLEDHTFKTGYFMTFIIPSDLYKLN